MQITVDKLPSGYLTIPNMSNIPNSFKHYCLERSNDIIIVRFWYNGSEDSTALITSGRIIFKIPNLKHKLLGVRFHRNCIILQKVK